MTTRLRPGYAEEDVDAFLTKIEHELKHLIQERDEARAECDRLRDSESSS